MRKGLVSTIFLLAGMAMTFAIPMNLSKGDYQKLLDKSLLSKGNNARLKAVISKMEKGEEVYIACLGGSVTEGECGGDYHQGYAYQFFDKLKQTYAKKTKGANLHFDGAGLSGTPSTLGLVRYQSDVVDVLGHVPDLLVIEFAVNDSGDFFCQRGFEALIRDALIQNDDTAVIALFSDAKSYKNQQPNMIPIARHYSLPMISIQDAVENSGVAVDENLFFNDYVHPKPAGHEVMADALMNLLAVTKKAAADEKNALPAECLKNPSLSGLKRILGDDENVKISAGAFNKNDSQTQSLKKTNKGNFPQNWYRSSRSKGDSFKMDIECRSLILVYKVQGSWLSEKFGKAEVYVDGKLFATYDGGAKNGWNNCESRLIIDEKEAKKHTVEVKMAQGDEDKGFTIVAMGYVK